jgi:hypothetical protein
MAKECDRRNSLPDVGFCYGTSGGSTERRRKEVGLSKISASHLERQACVYVRQSSMAQVQHHRESTQRQYNLRERAIGLGWRAEQVEVIDEDQGQSGSSAAGRGGFP